MEIVEKVSDRKERGGGFFGVFREVGGDGFGGGGEKNREAGGTGAARGAERLYSQAMGA